MTQSERDGLGQITWSTLFSDMQIRISTDFIDATTTTNGIQEALDDLPPDGGVVFIPRGIHEISTTINVPSFASVIGQGRATVVVAAGGTNIDVFTLVADVTDITIRDLVIDGRSIDNPTTGDGIQCDDGNLDCLFENLEIRNCRENGIHMEFVATRTARAVISNCYVHDCHPAAVAGEGGIVLETTDYCQVIDNIVTACHMGIALVASTYDIVHGNTCYANRDHGIIVDGVITNLSVCNNHSHNNGNNGIVITGTVEDVLVTDNICADNTNDGILVYRAVRSVVKDNVCMDNGNGDAGIHIVGDGGGVANYNVIAGNVCINAGVQGYGILLAGAGNANDNILMNNVCRGNTVEEIDDSGNRTVVAHNVTV